MKMRNLALTLAVGASITAAVPPAMAQTVLRYADYGPNRGDRAAAVMWFFDEVEKRSEGRLKVEPHWGGSLLSAPGMMDGLKAGVAAIVTATAAYTPKSLYLYGVGDQPIGDAPEVPGALAMLELAQTDPAIQKELDKADAVILANYTVGPTQLLCRGKDLVKTPEDLEGRKVRYNEGFREAFAAFGATPVKVTISEAYSGLDTGLLDCSQAYSYVAVSYKQFEVADQYVIIDAAAPLSNAMMMNKDLFESLSEADQQMLLDLGRELTRRNAEGIAKANVRAIKNMGEGIDGHALTITRWSDEDRARFNAEVSKSVDVWIKEAESRSYDGAGIVQHLRTLLAEKKAANP